MDLLGYYRSHGWIRSAITISVLILLILASIICVEFFTQKKLNDRNMESRCREISASIVGGMTHSLSIGDNDSVKAQFQRLNEILPEIEVYVYDDRSQIVFSTHPGTVGQPFEEYLGSMENVTKNREMLRTGQSGGLIRKRFNDRLFFGSLMPSMNEERCHACHDPDKAVIGGIAVWVDNSDGMDAIAKARNISLLIGILGVIMVIGVIWSIFSRMVGKLNETWDGIRKTSDRVAQNAQEVRKISNRIDSRAGRGNDMAAQSSAAATEISDYISTMAGAAEEVSQQINTVNQNSIVVSKEIRSSNGNISRASSNIDSMAASAGQMSVAVSTVATAMEQMYASQSEITKSASRCAAITSEASTDASRTYEVVSKLGAAATQIGDIIDLINGIAGKTNLLALNAAIEAAGAGEAGKGFAVVANEVKALARQTAEATMDIRKKIEGMQENTVLAVDAIEAITKVIKEIDTIAGAIASSVEEQTATTNEVSKNVAESAESADSVARNIHMASEKIREVAQSIRHVTDVEEGVSENLKQTAMAVEKIARKVSHSSRQAKTVSDNSERLSIMVNEILEDTRSQKDQTDDLANIAGELRELTKKFRI